MLVSQSCLTLCNPMDCSPPGCSIHEIFQARILEWVAISFSRWSSQPRDRTRVSCTAGRFFTDWAINERNNEMKTEVSNKKKKNTQKISNQNFECIKKKIIIKQDKSPEVIGDVEVNYWMFTLYHGQVLPCIVNSKRRLLNFK